MNSPVFFRTSLPGAAELRRVTGAKVLVVIADRHVQRRIQSWAKTLDETIWVTGGEKLKSLTGFESLARKTLRVTAGYSRSEIALVAVGGGSVGDAVGFLASVLKRGVHLVHIPSTWLAAADSAHGGKTALNIGSDKNQIGTFHRADATYCVRDILLSQSTELVKDAYGEFLKMGFVVGGELFRRLRKIRQLNPAALWKLLPLVVAGKRKIVKTDPLETKGQRLFLNLGHTVGHALELSVGLTHGRAVAYGLDFAIFWSALRGDLPAEKAREFRLMLTPAKLKTLSIKAKSVGRSLLKDKKATSGRRIRFVFLQGAGKPRVQSVPVSDIVRAIGLWKRNDLVS